MLAGTWLEAKYHFCFGIDCQLSHIASRHLFCVEVEAHPEIARVCRALVSDRSGREQWLFATHTWVIDHAEKLIHNQIREVDLLQGDRSPRGIVFLVDLGDVINNVVRHNIQGMQAFGCRPSEIHFGGLTLLQQLIDPLISSILAVNVERREKSVKRRTVSIVSNRGCYNDFVSFLRFNRRPG